MTLSSPRKAAWREISVCIKRVSAEREAKWATHAVKKSRHGKDSGEVCITLGFHIQFCINFELAVNHTMRGRVIDSVHNDAALAHQYSRLGVVQLKNRAHLGSFKL